MIVPIRKVYVSGPLTGLAHPTELKLFYESIALLCQQVGFSTHVPHLVTDPIKHPHVTPRQVFETDKHHVSTADLVIAYVGQPSLGVGMELAYTDVESIPVILMFEAGKTVSRFVLGLPNIIAEIKFDTYEDALQQLNGVLIGQSTKILSLSK